MENLQAMAVIIGIVNGMRLFQETDKRGFILFVIAVASGLLLGALHFFGLTIESGLVAALASSGLYRVGEKVGGN